MHFSQWLFYLKRKPYPKAKNSKNSIDNLINVQHEAIPLIMLHTRRWQRLLVVYLSDYEAPLLWTFEAYALHIPWFSVKRF